MYYRGLMPERDYAHSRILDVHRWSDHPESNQFVDEIYDSFLTQQESENIRIKKKHLKVVLPRPLYRLAG